ncbi:MAG TPA: AAA family ATPase [Candidatus Alectryocaccobium stercorigallinarum]|nr:AAA family ATPase [Candidatus Alectryocaccobium stercorigallinarum]
MILNRIKINRFGKLHDEKVEFTDGFNIVYGPNESGKSTLYGFIAAMLFGMNRSRGKASKTDDFTRFEPKEAPFEYSGRIEFESGGKEYILSRDFAAGKKRDMLVSADDMKTLSAEDTDVGRLLGGISQNTYKNTWGAAQGGETDAGALMQALTDRYSVYENGTQYDGTVSKSLGELASRRKSLEAENRRMQKQKEEEAAKLMSQISYVNGDIAQIKKQIDESRRQKCPDNKKAAVENRRYAQEGQTSKNKGGRRRSWLLVLVLILLICIGVGAAVNYISKNDVTLMIDRLISGGLKEWVLLVVEAVLIICSYLLVRALLKSRKDRTIYDEESFGDDGYISPAAYGGEDLKELSDERLNAYLKESLSKKQAEAARLSAKYENAVSQDAALKALETKIAGLKLAEDTIREIAEQSRSKYENRFKERAARIFEYLSAEEERKLIFDDELKAGLLSRGVYIPFWQLSKGTRDIIDISVRIAAAEIISGDEEMPLMLDDTFVNCDDDRLKRVLMFLKNLKRQVILFTCQKRESEVLDELGLKYTNVSWSGNEK